MQNAPADPYHFGAASGIAAPSGRSASSVPRVSPNLSMAVNPSISTSMGHSEAKGVPWSIALPIGGGLILIIGSLIAIIYSNVSSDVTDLKKDVKEIRSDIAGLSKLTTETNVRLGSTNEKLQTLIDETRRRPR